MQQYLKTLSSIVLITLCTTPLLAKNSRLEQEQVDQELLDNDNDDQNQSTDTSIDTTDIIILAGIIGAATVTATYFGLKQYYNVGLLEKKKELDPVKPENPSRGHK